MRKYTVLVSLFALAAFSQAELLKFSATLDKNGEPVPTNSNGIGNGYLEIDTVTLAYSGFLRWTGLTAIASDSHIHVGVPGSAGSVIYGIGGDAGAFDEGIYRRRNFSGTLIDKTPPNHGGAGTSGTLTPSQQISQWFLAEKTYFNVHTATYPGGEIRGVINAVPEPASMVALGLGAAALLRRRRK